MFERLKKPLDIFVNICYNVLYEIEEVDKVELNLTSYHEYLKDKLRGRIEKLDRKELWILTDGVDSQCKSYMRSKVNVGAELGIETKVITINSEMEFDEVIYDAILTKTPIILQLPINKKYEEKYNKIKNLVKPIDVDGFFRFQEVSEGDYSIAPATPKGILNYIKDEKGLNVDLRGKTVTIVGRGNLVGKPLAMMLINEGATVISLNSKTDKDFRTDALVHSDIVVLATGIKGSVKTSELPNTVKVINVGTCFDENNRLTTELDIDSHMKCDSIDYTPRIKGVGILTVLTLFENVVNFYENL